MTLKRILILYFFILPQIVSANSNPQITSLYQQAATGNATAQLAYALRLLKPKIVTHFSLV